MSNWIFKVKEVTFRLVEEMLIITQVGNAKEDQTDVSENYL